MNVAVNQIGNAIRVRLTGDGVVFDPVTQEASIAAEALASGVTLSLISTDAEGAATSEYEIAFKSTGNKATAPALLTSPSLKGSGRITEPVLVLPGVWEGRPQPTYAFQWLLDRAPINGAMQSSYTPTAANDGKMLACRVTASNNAGSTEAETSSTAIRWAPPQSAGNLMSVALTASVRAANIDFSKQISVPGNVSLTGGTWTRRSGSVPSGMTRVGGIVSGTPDTVAEEATLTLRYTNSGGFVDVSCAIWVKPAAVIAPTINSSTVTPSSGVMGNTFTSSFVGTLGSPKAIVLRQWYRNGLAIDGETGPTYKAVLADTGTISCLVKLNSDSNIAELESSAIRVDPDPGFVLAGAQNAMWLDPSDISEFYVDAGTTQASSTGQRIQRWSDKSGVGARIGTQEKSGSRPAISFHSGGRKSLFFDGLDDSIAFNVAAVLGGIVIGCTPDIADNAGVVGSASGTYVSVSSKDSGDGKARYRYRSSNDTSTSTMPNLTTRAQVASFNCLAPDASKFDVMTCYQDGIPAEDNPEDKQLITDCRLIGLRGSTTHYAGNVFGIISRDRPFSDAERMALQGWMARKTWEVNAGEELHVSGGIPFTVYRERAK